MLLPFNITVRVDTKDFKQYWRAKTSFSILCLLNVGLMDVKIKIMFYYIQEIQVSEDKEENKRRQRKKTKKAKEKKAKKEVIIIFLYF